MMHIDTNLEGLGENRVLDYGVILYIGKCHFLKAQCHVRGKLTLFPLKFDLGL